MKDVSRWQPKYFSDGKGGKFAPGCLTPHWGKVIPIALDSASQFRSPPPPKIGSKELIEEVKEVVEFQSNLTNEQKALVEFMRDGPKSVQQAGHWFMFAQNVSVRDNIRWMMMLKCTFLLKWPRWMLSSLPGTRKCIMTMQDLMHWCMSIISDKQIKAWGGPECGNDSSEGKRMEALFARYIFMSAISKLCFRS